MHSGLESVTQVKSEGCWDGGQGAGCRLQAAQSHTNIMQLLSVGQKTLLFSCSGTRHKNAQILNSRWRHRDTGSKVSLSHSLYMLHLCVVPELIQSFHAQSLSRTAPGKSDARPAEERWARAEASSSKTFRSLTASCETLLSPFSLNLYFSFPCPARTSRLTLVCTGSKQLTLRREAWARSSARGRRGCLHPWLEFYPEGTESPGQTPPPKTSKTIMRKKNIEIMFHQSIFLKATLGWCSILYGVCWNCRISLMMCDI